MFSQAEMTQSPRKVSSEGPQGLEVLRSDLNRTITQKLRLGMGLKSECANVDWST